MLKEKEHAQQFIDYITERGGKVVLKDIQAGEVCFYF